MTKGKDEPTISESYLTIPNIITSFRFILLPLTVLSILNQEFIRAAALVLISFATDVLDGFIARRWDQHSEFGRIIDPLSDKIGNILVLGCLSWLGLFPIWALILFVFREVVIMGSSLYLILSGQNVIPSLIYGRIAGVFFIFTEVVYLLNIRPLLMASLIVFLLMMMFALIKYLESFSRVLSGKEL